MGNNQEQNKDHDPEYENAMRSMGHRMDSDPNPKPKEEEKPKEETPPANPNPPANPPKEEKKDITPENPNPAPHEDDPANKKPPVNRNERFIPLKKFHDTERAHKEEVAVLTKQIEDLKQIANQKPSEEKDEDIEKFMNETGFSREVVEGLLKLAEKRVLTPELKEAIKKAEVIVNEAEIDTSFTKEFTSEGEPALKTHFPNISAEQLEKAREYLDQIAHTKAYSDKPLDYIIFKEKAELEKILGGQASPDTNPNPPQDKKTIEPNRMGSGKPTGLTAKDFVGQKDFSSLNGMDPAARNELIKGFDDKTYDNFTAWVASQNNGVEVMRNGQRITLK